MVHINDHLVGLYFKQKYTGRKPFFFEHLLNPQYVKEYEAKLSAIASELNQHEDPNDLIPYIQNHYGFSINYARQFAQANTNYNWIHGNSEDKKAMLIHANNSFNMIPPIPSLDEIVKEEKDDSL